MTDVWLGRAIMIDKEDRRNILLDAQINSYKEYIFATLQKYSVSSANSHVWHLLHCIALTAFAMAV